jgi:hypothetical protein
MDSELDKSPGLALPQPSNEQAGVSIGEYPSVMPETASAAPEMVSSPAMQSAVPIAPPTASIMSQPSTQTVADPQAAASAASAADDDSDALDEEWVNKAKAIVERTRDDPYAESNELSKAKADYLRIRYNKQIKVAEDNQR